MINILPNLFSANRLMSDHHLNRLIPHPQFNCKLVRFCNISFFGKDQWNCYCDFCHFFVNSIFWSALHSSKSKNILKIWQEIQKSCSATINRFATVKCLLISRQKSWQFQKIQHSICVDSFANRSDNLVAVQGKKTDSKTKATLTTDKCKCKTYLNPKRQDFCYQLLNRALICWSPWM